MDGIALLRQLRSDFPEPTEEALALGRAALHARFAEVTNEVTPKRWPWVMAAAAAAAVIAAAAVVVPVIWPIATYPAAADVLRGAAEVSATDVDPSVAPGEYLVIESTNAVSVTAGKPDGGMVAWLERSDSSVYVPADVGAEWVWERGAGVPYSFFGPQAEAFASQVPGTPAETTRAAGGRFFGEPPEYPIEFLNKLPHDPEALLESIYARGAGAGPSREGQAFTDIIEILASGLATTELRTALYEAAALIPGVFVLDSATDLDGRPGIALGRLESVNDLRHEMILDQQSGLFLGHRVVTVTGNSAADIPAGAVLEWSSVRTRVADAAP